MEQTLLTGQKGDVGSILFNMYQNYQGGVAPLDINIDRPAKRIVHLAARALPTSTEKILDSNILYLQEVIKYAARNGIEELIFFSSVSVYGGQNKEDVGEDERLCDPDLYGLTKLIGEKLLQAAQLRVLCLRLPAILGYRNLTNYMSRCFEKLRRNEPYEISNAHRLYNNFISAESLFRFIEKVEMSKLFDVINLASRKEKTLLEVAEILKAALGSRSDIRILDKAADFFNISTKKAEGEYGFIPAAAEDSIAVWARQRLNKC